MAYYTINFTKWEVVTILHKPIYSSINKHSLVMDYITGIFNLTTKNKTKRYYSLKHGGIITCSQRIISTQKLTALLLLLGAQWFSTICRFTVANITFKWYMLVPFLPNTLEMADQCENLNIKVMPSFSQEIFFTI